MMLKLPQDLGTFDFSAISSVNTSKTTKTTKKNSNKFKIKHLTTL
jgi:hypothetical protein